MRQNPGNFVRSLFIAVIAACWSITSHAFVVSIDEFSIIRNTVGFFTDSFTDGNEPPSAPNFLVGGGTATYNVFGTIPSTAESGEKLLLDTANGAVSANAIDLARIEVRARLLTDIDPTDLAAGLKSNDTLSLTGIFSATAPSGVFNPQYSIRLDDASGGTGSHQILQLQVTFRTVAGLAEIRYILQDFDADTITILGTAPFAPPAGADEILLNINRPNIASNDFFGSFAYLTGGVAGAPSQFLLPGQMFQGENFVRAGFNASDGFILQAVPEPGTAWLFGLASLFLLLGMRRARG